MKFRELPAKEWGKLRPIFEANSSSLPEPSLCTALVAEDEGEIVGMDCLQYFVRVGPMWIHEDYLGDGLWREMRTRLDKKMMEGNSSYFMFVKDGRNEHMARSTGMKGTGFGLWVKDPVK